MPGNPNILSNSATPEMLSPVEGLPAFFGWAEKNHPQGVKELVGVIGSLMPEGGEAATEQGIRDGLTNSKLDMGFNVLSSWLTDVGAGGFRDINGAMRWGFLQAAKANKIRFPAKEKVSGREVQAVLKSFSATMKNAEAGGMRPTQIVGNLLQESVGSKLTNNGSATLRTELVRALGGEQNLTWLWIPLGIPDAAGQSGFKPVAAEPKPAAAPKPLPEISRAEAEFIRKKNRIKQYLTQEGEMDSLARTWDEDKWEHVGDDGSVKRVYRPRRGILAGEEVCLRENISDQVISYRESAPIFRPETRFLKQVKGPHFVRVYVHAPLDQADLQGVGRYRADRHWELVDFVEGVAVARENDREHNGIYWPEPLSPAVRLKVVLAACENEDEALNLARPGLSQGY